jgi:hypothetical protein
MGACRIFCTSSLEFDRVKTGDLFCVMRHIFYHSHGIKLVRFDVNAN